MFGKIWMKLALTIVGALGGYLYYHFVGCASGTCPITSNPVISTLYGAVLGFLLSVIFAPTKSRQGKS